MVYWARVHLNSSLISSCAACTEAAPPTQPLLAQSVLKMAPLVPAVAHFKFFQMTDWA